MILWHVVSGSLGLFRVEKVIYIFIFRGGLSEATVIIWYYNLSTAYVIGNAIVQYVMN
jgi:hypothetical protein